ncbi:MAG: phosphotransferase [Gammaproteobacteria bacterium]|nr:phosphotransferase [Gammaproteobacteria bacterium]
MIDQTEQNLNHAELDTIGQATLTPLVHRALNSKTIEIINWRYSQVHGGVGDGAGILSGIYRFTGSGIDQGKTIPWSLILKILGSGTSNDEPAEPTYWKREVLAYQSGQLEKLPGSLTAPQCFAVVEQSDREAWLWLEDITDEIGVPWSLEHYGLVARHLGRFNGAYLSEDSLPSWSWLSRRWLRMLVNRAEPGIELLRRSLGHPLVSRLFPHEQASRTFALWEERDRFLDALDHLPQTICHRDAHRRNLFMRHGTDGCEQFVMIDWALAGVGAIGEEITSLINGSIELSEVEPTLAKTLDDIVFRGYLAGLEDAGWQGDPRLVRFGYAASSVLCFNIGYGLGYTLDMILDKSQHPWIERVFGQPIEIMLDTWVINDRFRLDLADEARILLADLDELKD